MAKSSSEPEVIGQIRDPARSPDPASPDFGIDDICVRDVETKEFRNSVVQLLPITDPSRRAEALARVITDVRWFRALCLTLPRQLSAAEVRENLLRGAASARDLENWTKGTPLIIRDYVLSAIGDQPLIGERTLPNHEWANLGEFFGRFAEKVEVAVQLVRTDRGRPDNTGLNDLVWSLGLIWDEFVPDPLFGLTKKRPAPYDFVKFVCRAAAPEISEADLERQLKTALRSAAARLRKRRSSKSVP